MVGILWLAACHTAPATIAGNDYVYIKQGRRVWPVQDQALVRIVEVRLAANGFDPGPVDGVADERTRQAVVAFQKSQGLSPTGVIDSSTARALDLRWSRIRGDVRSARLEP